MGWTREQAIDYLASNTALPLHEITTEVDRYISWPGQALSYKLGELKITELRAKAEEALGLEIRRPRIPRRRARRGVASARHLGEERRPVDRGAGRALGAVARKTRQWELWPSHRRTPRYTLHGPTAFRYGWARIREI